MLFGMLIFKKSFQSVFIQFLGKHTDAYKNVYIIVKRNKWWIK